MCVIVIKMAGRELPKAEYMKNCEHRNKDGIGVALHKSEASEITIKKTFKNADELNVWLVENVRVEDTCIVHFRIATHGKVDEGNRHPFPITKNKEMLRQTELICKLAVAHNGVISQYGHETKFSDTQQFIIDILSDEAIKNNIENPTIQKLISNYIANDRLVIMLENGKTWRWGTWHEHEGIFYSNTSYEAIKEYMYDRWNDVSHFDKCKTTSPYFEGVCDNCGKEKKVIMIEDSENNVWLFCKTCREKYNKCQLEISTLGKINKKSEFLKSKELTVKNEEQCHSCTNWFPKEEVTDYYGQRLCIDCGRYYNNLIKPKVDEKETLPKHYQK